MSELRKIGKLMASLNAWAEVNRTYATAKQFVRNHRRTYRPTERNGSVLRAYLLGAGITNPTYAQLKNAYSELKTAGFFTRPKETK